MVRAILGPKEKEKKLTLLEMREQLDALIAKEAEEIKQKAEGDGKAVYFESGSEAEYEEYDRLENKGWKGFYKKIFNIK